MEVGQTFDQLHAAIDGLSLPEVASRLRVMGRNQIPFAVDSWSQACAAEFYQVFYLYQFLIYVRDLVLTTLRFVYAHTFHLCA